MIANERRDNMKPLVRAIGNARTGVGTRIKGHLKYDGKVAPKAMQTERYCACGHRISIMCPFCRVIHPRKVKNGKTIMNNGASYCINSDCESCVLCKNSFGRDSLSSTCIAFRCYGQVYWTRFVMIHASLLQFMNKTHAMRCKVATPHSVVKTVSTLFYFI
ncbi:uncharacterized protein BX664DRAFT_359128 [Halteromyces radiatus]|uniref:uncharacterized protein n=1 Tax=Halteromyces radiatus TaxID=101107 RepID=UPI00221EDEB5|nr:uncharacterized protein BX664DRAFT_359128 [Halteromyces radiatus]KAI8089590.1 hypothetical protein BX664DRAFT_359128 [Halteromyces radiatus]